MHDSFHLQMHPANQNFRAVNHNFKYIYPKTHIWTWLVETKALLVLPLLKIDILTQSPLVYTTDNFTSADVTD